MALTTKIEPFEQFNLHTVGGPLGGSVNFTQANLAMVAAVALMLALLHFGMRRRAVVPGRLQALAELGYGFIHDMTMDQIGPEGQRFFPFVFTLFFFVLFGNLIGLIPYQFTYTSHIAVTFALAIAVFVLATGFAIGRHGRHFFSYFFPEGVPVLLAPVIIPIEIISYLSRPISLSVRLFANMIAGHVMFVVLATFVVTLAGAGAVGVAGAIGPLALTVVLEGFELLVAALQAYVFAILTCIYLHDAVHLH